jgi:5-methylcytosine-specific restriction endonuclease McrA
MKICKKCGSIEFYTNGGCKDCKKAYHVANREKHLKNFSDYAKNNRERMNAQSRRWNADNPQARRRFSTNYYANNKYLAKKRNDAYRKANPNSDIIKSHTRRARKAAAGGKLSIDLKPKLFKLQNGKCACCSKPLGKNCEIDHVIPLSLGGSNEDSNTQLLRQFCNRSKGGKHPVQYMQEKGFLI